MITKTVTHPLGLVLTALEDVKIILYSKLVSFVNILFAIILVMYYDALGVAFATCFSILIKDAIIFGYARRKYGLRLPILDILKIIMISSIILVVGYCVKYYTSNLVIVGFSLISIIILSY
jgi:O-antigen/teichoic acid export membrane protein